MKRIKVVFLRDYQMYAEMHYLERDVFGITIKNECSHVIQHELVNADSFGHAREAFTRWIHAQYPKL